MKSADPGPALRLVRFLHQGLVFSRRASVLSALLAQSVQAGNTVLDVGCGNGTIGYLMKQIKPTIAIQGLEVMLRPSCLIECARFDGMTIPLPDSSVDVCMFVDVLHHALDIDALLGEARRVTRSRVLIKDHLCETHADRAVLTFMDWVGNRAHGVRLPYDYHSQGEWRRLFARHGLQVVEWNQNLPLYPRPFSALFGRGLHCIALLEKVPVSGAAA